MLVDGAFPPISVSGLFEQAPPDIDCHTVYTCYVLFRQQRRELYHNLDIWPGSFVKLFAWQSQGSEESTTCGSDGEMERPPPNTEADELRPSDDGETDDALGTANEEEANIVFMDTDLSDFSEQSLDITLFMPVAPQGLGENTATPQGIQAQDRFEVPHLNRPELFGNFDPDLVFVEGPPHPTLLSDDPLWKYLTQRGTGRPVRAVHVWIVKYLHEPVWVPYMILADSRPLVGGIWQRSRDEGCHDDIGLTLEAANDFVHRDRAVPNLLGATRDQLRLGYRAYMVEHSFDAIPQKQAWLFTGRELGRDVIARTGYGDRCLRRPCYLVRSRQGVHEVWGYYDHVAEPHGTSFLISYTRGPECVSAMDEMTAPAQEPELISSVMLLQTEVSVESSGETDQSSLLKGYLLPARITTEMLLRLYIISAIPLFSDVKSLTSSKNCPP